MDNRSLFKLSYGVYLVSSRVEKKLNAQIANAVMQVTSEPLQIAFALNKKNLTHEYLQGSGLFTISVLAQSAPLSLIGRFGFKSGREIDKFAEVPYRLGKNGCPYLTENTLCYLEGKVAKEIDIGSHTLFISEITEAEVLSEGEPMTYAFYHQVKRGTTPKTAPTYIKTKMEEVKMKKYICKVCGYVYDPTLGDPETKIAPGTPFEKLPDDWVCPVCGAGKEQFEEES